ncbi:MAG TPA: FKBP-type peptidyl-prolyl cis-trans isomerase [Candidatus Absconditabacterales bacterium]|nr:FKBP-type peptidyl-prolyl cis-trans isomerase [Candidatus Absconditabacterales bacterium]
MKKTKKYDIKKLFLGVGILVIVLVILGVLFSKEEKTMCEMTVEEYLQAADFEGDGQEVQKGNDVVVHYIGRLKDGTVFDTSVEEVAKACDKHNPERDYTQGLPFKVGAGQMIAGFDRGVEGMKVGQTKTIEILAEDAYGEHNKELIMVVEKEKLDLPGQYKQGDVLYAPNGQSVKVLKVTEKEVHLDANHELAGKDLIFDITVKEIK